MTQQIARVTDTSTDDELMAAIRALRDRQRRMPAHWADRRAEVGDEIDELVARLVHH